MKKEKGGRVLGFYIGGEQKAVGPDLGLSGNCFRIADDAALGRAGVRRGEAGLPTPRYGHRRDRWKPRCVPPAFSS